MQPLIIGGFYQHTLILHVQSRVRGNAGTAQHVLNPLQHECHELMDSNCKPQGISFHHLRHCWNGSCICEIHADV